MHRYQLLAGQTGVKLAMPADSKVYYSYYYPLITTGKIILSTYIDSSESFVALTRSHMHRAIYLASFPGIRKLLLGISTRKWAGIRNQKL